MSSIEEKNVTKGTKVKKINKRWKDVTIDEIEEIPKIACPKCPLTFGRECNYKKHLQLAHSLSESEIKVESVSSLEEIKESETSASIEEKLWECTKCSERFHQEFALSKHLEIHSIHESVNCKKCNKEFLDETSLKQHELTHAQEPQNKENKSSENDEQEEQLNKNELEKDSIYCNICNRNFFYESALEKHKELHLVKEAIFACKQCPQKFFQRTNLVQHEYTHSRPVYKCYTCEKFFHKNYHLKAHLRLHGKEGQTMNCDQCGKSFKNKPALEAHIKNHSKPSRFICKGCESEFSNKHSFLRHIQAKINNSTMYRCKYCGKICCHKRNLDNHLLSHDVGSVPFRCIQCNAQFSDKNDFRNHMYSTHVTINAKIIPTVNICKGCNTEFSSEVNLFKHLSVNSQEDLLCKICKRQYQCLRAFQTHICNLDDSHKKRRRGVNENMMVNYTEEIMEATSYRTPLNRIKHRDHTYALQSWPIKPYKCKKCGRHFCRLVNLEKHIQEIHPESSEENSEDEDQCKEDEGVSNVFQIATINSLQTVKEKVFVSGDNIEDHVAEQDDDLVDPLLLDDQMNRKSPEMVVDDVQGPRTIRNCLKIEPGFSEEDLQLSNKTQVKEIEIINIKQEIMDYDSS